MEITFNAIYKEMIIKNISLIYYAHSSQDAL